MEAVKLSLKSGNTYSLRSVLNACPGLLLEPKHLSILSNLSNDDGSYHKSTFRVFKSWLTKQMKEINSMCLSNF